MRNSETRRRHSFSQLDWPVSPGWALGLRVCNQLSFWEGLSGSQRLTRRGMFILVTSCKYSSQPGFWLLLCKLIVWNLVCHEFSRWESVHQRWSPLLIPNVPPGDSDIWAAPINIPLPLLGVAKGACQPWVVVGGTWYILILHWFKYPPVPLPSCVSWLTHVFYSSLQLPVVLTWSLSNPIITS